MLQKEISHHACYSNVSQNDPVFEDIHGIYYISSSITCEVFTFPKNPANS